MHYHLGPIPWTADEFAPPAQTLGWIDLGALPAQGTPGSARAMGFFARSEAAPALPSEYTLLGTGDLRELPATAAMQAAFESVYGYRPAGATLVDLLADSLISGGDPDGQLRAKPLLPGTHGRIELHLGGHSRVWWHKFHWGATYTGLVAATVHANYRRLRTANRAEAAEDRLLSARMTGSWGTIMASTHPTNVKHRKRLQSLRSSGITVAQAKAAIDARAVRLEEQERRVLDAWREKYRLGDGWLALVPQELRAGHPGPLPHETTISDAFTRANSTDISTGAPFAWTEVLGDLEINSNQLRNVTTGQNSCRAESDLSTDDHTVTLDVTTVASSSSLVGPASRYDSAADSYYALRLNGGTSNLRIIKVTTGTITALGVGTTQTLSAPDTLQLDVNGTALDCHFNGASVEAITDSTFSGQLRTGIFLRSIASPNFTIADNFQASDFAVAADQPAMRRWGGVPHMRARPIAGRSW